MIFAGILGLALAEAPNPPGAAADPKTLPKLAAVRAIVAGGSRVTIGVKKSDGSLTEVDMHDDGLEPDSKAADSEFAAIIPLEGDGVTVSMKVDGKSADAPPVTWGASAERRLLAIRWTDGAITAEAKVGDAAKGMTGAPGATSGSASAVPELDLPSGPRSKTSSTVYAGLALAGMALVGISVLLFRRAADDTGADPDDYDALRVAGAGLLGAGTPGVDTAAQVWGVARADRPALVARTIAALAASHPVVVAAANSEPVPSVRGLSVFRSSEGREQVEALAGRLTSGARPTVIVVMPPFDTPLDAWRLPARGCRIIVVTASDQSGLDASFSQTDGVWSCTHGEQTVPLA